MLLGIFFGDESLRGTTERELVAASARLDQRQEQVAARHSPSLLAAPLIFADNPSCHSHRAHRRVAPLMAPPSHQGLTRVGGHDEPGDGGVMTVRSAIHPSGPSGVLGVSASHRMNSSAAVSRSGAARMASAVARA